MSWNMSKLNKKVGEKQTTKLLEDIVFTAKSDAEIKIEHESIFSKKTLYSSDAEFSKALRKVSDESKIKLDFYLSQVIIKNKYEELADIFFDDDNEFDDDFWKSVAEGDTPYFKIIITDIYQDFVTNTYLYYLIEKIENYLIGILEKKESKLSDILHTDDYDNLYKKIQLLAQRKPATDIALLCIALIKEKLLDPPKHGDLSKWWRIFQKEFNCIATARDGGAKGYIKAFDHNHRRINENHPDDYEIQIRLQSIRSELTS